VKIEKIGGLCVYDTMDGLAVGSKIGTHENGKTDR
jgi:hypothetical protein